MSARSHTLVLASGSPRRRDLIAQLGYRAEGVPAAVEEWEAPDADPTELVSHNALLKANHVAAIFPDRPILAADTTVALDHHVLNKPADLDAAGAMLQRLSGRTHVVHTGVHLCWPARAVRVAFVETSEVTFRPLDRATIARYFTLVDPLDKAGAYGIQDGRELIVAGWTGSLHNIMGLPTERLVETFEQLGWDRLLTRSP